jgi:hypothetical protein
MCAFMQDPGKQCSRSFTTSSCPFTTLNKYKKIYRSQAIRHVCTGPPALRVYIYNIGEAMLYALPALGSSHVVASYLCRAVVSI